MRQSRGFALLSVLWLALILGLVAASLADIARRSAGNARTLETATNSGQVLNDIRTEAIFHLAAYQREAADTATILPDGSLRQLGAGDVQVYEADGLLDLTQAAPELLEAAGLRSLDGVTHLNDPRIPAEMILLVTLYSGRTMPDLSLGPPELSDILSAFPTPSAGEDASPPRRRTGGVYHIRAWVGARGREWVVYLPAAQEAVRAPWYLLEMRNLPARDALLASESNA